MAQQQQTVLRVQTNREVSTFSLPVGTITVASGTTMTMNGSGTTLNPFNSTGSTSNHEAYFNINNNGGIVYYMISGQTSDSVYIWEPSSIDLIRDGVSYQARSTNILNAVIFGQINVLPGDQIYVTMPHPGPTPTRINYLYFVPNTETGVVYEDENLDLYTDIPIKINKSFAELQDISKRNSDFSIGLQLPGSKKNNAFFESYFNVDVDTLYFNPLLRVPSTVLINDEVYFDGYLKLNKISVLDSKVEYDVTLFSTIGDLFGKIGNNLLKDLPFDNPTMLFNHVFDIGSIYGSWNNNGFDYDGDPKHYMYPITHNGYNYSGDTVLLSGSTYSSITGQTRLYSTTSPISGFTSLATMYAAGVQPYRSNSPTTGLYDNQLKPSLNIWAIIQLMFKTYGYTIKSDFMNTPWMKGLYMYGYFNSDATKFSYVTNPSLFSGNTQAVTLTETFVDVLEGPPCNNIKTTRTYTIKVVNSKTGVPEISTQPYAICLDYALFPCSGGTVPYAVNLVIPSSSTGTTYSWVSNRFIPCPSSCALEYTQNYGLNQSNSNISVYQVSNAPQVIGIKDGDYVNFNLIINDQLKQIDILSSIAKKFNLLFIPDPEVQNQIIIEPYQYYVGTGQIYDWTDKLSYDKGWSVQPALNFVESEIILTDLEDGDDGNKQFKERNNRIYGQNFVFNQTDFKSTTKKIETIFSPQVMRRWDATSGNTVSIPLGINYVSSNSQENSGGSEKVKWAYKGVKTKPKLFYYLGNRNAFLNTLGKVYNTSSYRTFNFQILASDGTNFGDATDVPVISNTMPLGNPDDNKINNDSICILFNSEQPTDVGVETFDGVNSYTEQDMYNLFYENRINNLYNPNTRFLSGYFWLKQSDIKNLTPKDIIKIKEQYFSWNKISGFNMTNPELTQVELVQIDNNPSSYTTRYFQYYYCADTGTTYNIKTDFTNPQMNLTHFYISNWYDFNVGTLGGNVSGVTSSLRGSFPGGTGYLPFYMYEITEDTYNTTGTIYTDDPNIDWDSAGDSDLKLNSFWYNTGFTKTGLNLFTSCSDFASIASANGIRVGTPSGSTPTSIYHSGITLNITDTGWLKYDTATGTVYKQFTSLGNQDIPDCANCSTIRDGIPFADLASWTVVDCGSACP
jgi:hypothetical protein